MSVDTGYAGDPTDSRWGGQRTSDRLQLRRRTGVDSDGSFLPVVAIDGSKSAGVNATAAAVVVREKNGHANSGATWAIEQCEVAVGRTRGHAPPADTESAAPTTPPRHKRRGG